ncbi:MAG: hypothetical protein ACP5XB_19475 [Isosphaeraceae bacterium]
METAPVDWNKTLGVLEELRREVRRLADRVGALEAASHAVAKPEARPPAAAPAAGEPAAPPGLDEELIVIIASAIAAFLGKKPHIRQIRLIGSAAWAQQGRVTIQASHALSAHSTRSLP